VRLRRHRAGTLPQSGQALTRGTAANIGKGILVGVIILGIVFFPEVALPGLAAGAAA